MELHRFLLILDKETLSGNATIQKGLLSDLLQTYSTSNGMRNLLKNENVLLDIHMYAYDLICKSLDFS